MSRDRQSEVTGNSRRSRLWNGKGRRVHAHVKTGGERPVVIMKVLHLEVVKRAFLLEIEHSGSVSGVLILGMNYPGVSVTKLDGLLLFQESVEDIIVVLPEVGGECRDVPKFK